MSSVVKNMEDKKARQKAQSQGSNLKGSSVMSFFENIKNEFKKVTWTSREELKTYTQIVIGATFVMGMAIWGVDMLIQFTLSSLSSLIRVILG